MIWRKREGERYRNGINWDWFKTTTGRPSFEIAAFWYGFRYAYRLGVRLSDPRCLRPVIFRADRVRV